MPRRTRALPDRANPFSRLREPLSSGEPGQAAVTGDGAPVAQLARKHFRHQHLRRLEADALDARQHQNHRMRAFARRLFEPRLARLLDLLDLIGDEAQLRHVAPQLRQGVGRQRLARSGAQFLELFGRLAQFRIEAADAQPRQRALHPIDEAAAGVDPALALAGGRLPSSSASVWIAAMLQWSASPRSQPRNARISSSVSSRSVLARR